MKCVHCGRELDAQALELGACRYCGQSIPGQGATMQNASPAAGPGNTSPTILKQNQMPSNTMWTENALTEFGPLSFAPPNTPQQGALPFAINAPPANVPSPGGYAQQGAYPPFSAAPAALARKGGGKKLVLAIVAIVLLAAVIGGGLLFARNFNTAATPGGTNASASSPNPAQPTTASQPTATPTVKPTPTSIPTSAYNDPNGLFSIRYPTAWTHDDFSPAGNSFPLPLNGVRFHSGDAELVILTGQEVPGLPTDGLAEQANDALLSMMNAQNVSSARPVQIGGKTWTEKEADTDGGKHTVIASISVNGHIYSLWYSAPASELSADEQQVFNPMIASFTFGG